MALRVFQYAATIPAGTLKTEPHTVDLDLTDWDVQRIDLEVPAGPAGLMGFYVANNGVQWYPKSPGQWLVWDDRSDTWHVEDQPNASGWQIVGYNTGTYDHTVTIRFHVVLPSPPAAGSPAPAIQIVNTPLPQPAVILT